MNRRSRHADPPPRCSRWPPPPRCSPARRARAGQVDRRVASTTSTQDSGLFGHILPLFKAKTGIDVKVVVAGHRPGARHRPARRRRRGVRPRQAAGGEIRRRRLRREALPRHVQRLRADRAEERSRRHQGHRRTSSRRSRRSRQGSAVHLARRQVRHARRRTRAVEGAGIDIADADKGPWYARSARAWARRSTPRPPSSAYVLADRGTWLSFKNRGDLDIVGRGRQAAVQPVRRHPGESGQASAREEGARPGLHRLADVAEGQKAIADYKINGEQLFFPNANAPGA